MDEDSEYKPEVVKSRYPWVEKGNLEMVRQKEFTRHLTQEDALQRRRKMNSQRR